jgi:hypothetical protein
VPQVRVTVSQAESAGLPVDSLLQKVTSSQERYKQVTMYKARSISFALALPLVEFPHQDSHHSHSCNAQSKQGRSD